MSQVIFLSIIYWLFSERHLHQIVLRAHDCLVGKAAGKERLFPPSAFTGFVLDSHTFKKIFFFTSEFGYFWSFSLETLPF